jgi:hypothetical protein
MQLNVSSVAILPRRHRGQTVLRSRRRTSRIEQETTAKVIAKNEAAMNTTDHMKAPVSDIAY